MDSSDGALLDDERRQATTSNFVAFWALKQTEEHRGFRIKTIGAVLCPS